MKYFTLAEANNKVYITTNTNNIMVYDVATDRYSVDLFPRFIYNTVASHADHLYFPREQDITCYNPDTKDITFLDISPAATHEANVVVNNKLYLPCICDYDYDADGSNNRIALMKVVDLSDPDNPQLRSFSSNSVLIDDRDDSLTNSIDGDLIGPTEQIKSCIHYAGKIYIPVSNRGFDNGTSFNSNLIEYDIASESVSRIYSIPKDDYGQCCTMNNWLYLTAPGKVIKFNMLTSECFAAFDVLGTPLSIMSDRACLYTITRKRILKWDTRTNQMSEIASINLEQFIRDGNIVARDRFGVVKLVEIKSDKTISIREINNVFYAFDSKNITITDDWGDILFDISELFNVEFKKKCNEIEAVSQIALPPDLSQQEADGKIVIHDEFGNIIVNETYVDDTIWGKDETGALSGITIVSSVEYGVNNIKDILSEIELIDGGGLIFDKNGNIKELEADSQAKDDIIIPEEKVVSGGITIRDEFGNIIINESYTEDTIWGKDQVDVLFGNKVISEVTIGPDIVIDTLSEINIEKVLLNIRFNADGTINEIEADSQVKDAIVIPEEKVIDGIVIRDEFGNIIINETYVDDTIWGKDELSLPDGKTIINEVIIGPDIVIDILSEITIEKELLNIRFNADGTINEIEAEGRISSITPGDSIDQINGGDVVIKDELGHIIINESYTEDTIWGKDQILLPDGKTIISQVIIGPNTIQDLLGEINIEKELLNISIDADGIINELEARPLRYNSNIGYSINDEVIL